MREGKKVTQEYVLEYLKKFIFDNESLIHLDLSNTGMDAAGIVDLVKFLKLHQDTPPDNQP